MTKSAIGVGGHGASSWLGGRGRLVLEVLFWIAAFASIFVLPRKLLLLNDVAITALFALSLDLILGYAGLVSLGHAAFLGVGAYAAGLLVIHVTSDPLVAILVAALAGGGLGFLTSFLVLRGTDLTRLMVTLGIALLLGEAANKAGWLTGGADGLQGMTAAPVLGMFRFDMGGRTAYCLSLTTLFVLFLIARRLAASPFGLTLRTIRDNPLRASAIGVPVTRRLVTVYTIAATYAGVAGGLLAVTTQFVSLDVFDFARSADVMLVLILGGTGYLYGGILGAVVFKVLQDILSTLTPQYWHFWIGLLLVILMVIGRQRFGDWFQRLMGQKSGPGPRS
jgi:branched-chain amino acid transport system permease protein